MTAVTQLGPDLFRVDLQILDRTRPGRRKGGLRSWFRSLAPQPVVLDPYLVTRAVLEVMDCCALHSPTGRLLVWNDYRVFLARSDHDRLRPLESILHQEMEPMLYEQLQQRQAETVGDLAVRILLDEGDDLQSGSLLVRVAFASSAAGQQPAEGEITIRVGQPVYPDAQGVAAADGGSTVRVDEPGPGVIVRWPGGQQRVALGRRVVLGRPHDDAQGSFISLTGASSRVSRRHVWIETQVGGVLLLGRLSDANPVQVQGRLVQPGGSIAIDTLPVQVSLSGGDLLLTLDDSGVDS